MHAVVIDAIDGYLRRRGGEHFAGLSDEVMELHAALLDRLAQ